MKIFIAGCARSGTGLAQRLMKCFAEVSTVDGENDYHDYEKLTADTAHVVLKRRRDSHRDLPDLPSDIELIYMVRHPLEALTSKHPSHHRRFYVSEQRWRAEYDSLKALRAAQPRRRIIFVRYDELVTTPDFIQARIADVLSLKVREPFSKSGFWISSSSLALYEKEPYRRLYVRLLSTSIKVELKEFCDEFGFQLPLDYVRPASRIGDAVRRFAAWNLRKEWWSS